LSKKTNRRLSLPVAIITYVVAAALAVGLVIANVITTQYSSLISVYFGQATQQVVSADGSSADYFTSDYASAEERTAAITEIATNVEREGITLLQNDGALPLAADAKVTVFGQDFVDPVYGGGGAGSIDTSKAIDLQTAFADAGLDVNPTLTDFYTDGAGKDFRKTTPDVYGQGSFSVNEVPVTLYTEAVKASFGDYADAAIVVIGRSGGESSDLATAPDEDGNTYLQLSAEEKDTLALAAESFDTVIVLLNTQNPVELGFLEDTSISAALWVGAFGQTGATAVAEALTGVVNPSGALVDTYAYDSLSAPSMENFGDYTIANSTVDRGDKYMVYAEGIYVGYQYYETRYEDVVLGTEPAVNFDYATQVQFPFGFGSSYTSFEWSDYTVTENGDAYDVAVTVTNSGDVAGKDVVQVYLQSPYTEYDKANGIEKPSVELAGYAKTASLEAGTSETVTVSVPKESFKAYDADGYGTYIVDEGDYYLAAGENAHEALNSILAAKGFTTADGMDADGNADLAFSTTVGSLDSTTYAASQETGAAITNEFADVDVRTYDEGFTYLSRSDWTGTWPATYADGEWTAPEQMLADLEIPVVDETVATAPSVGTVNDQYGELSTATLIDEDYSSPAWDALIGQMSADDIDKLTRVGGYATQTIESITLPATVDKDGPAGISGTLVGGDSGMGFPTPIVLASSWNDELAEQVGAAIGEDSLALGVTGWYAPSMNIHRSPYSGRNFEYYSEDALLSGKMGAAVVTGAQSKGVLVYVKHFALNDQEANRVGGAIFANEQSTRELYLAPFEITVREGDARGIMASMNRIGATWSGAHAGLMTAALRDEWGFTGLVITDQASYSVFAYEDLRAGLAAGTDLWLNSDASLWVLEGDQVTPTVMANQQRAAKNIVFAIANSNAMNGIASDSKIVPVTPLWQWTLIAITVLGGLALAFWVFVTTRRLVLQKRAATVTVE
jgi:beta-glucosidase